MPSKLIEYRENNTTLEAYCAYPADISTPRPAVIVIHDWSGRNDFACKKADKLAELGYIGFALDMYGKGKLGNTKEEKIALMQPVISDRSLLLKRLLAAYTTLKALTHVDPSRIGAIGFCFGGLCALDLARSGADVAGVVSFHGLLNAPEKLPINKIKAKMLILHGYDDPMVKPDQVIQFANEMTKQKVDWEINMYSHTMHAFSNPEANDPGFGTVYNKQADARSWIAMREFFSELGF